MDSDGDQPVFGLSTELARADDQVFAELDGELVLMHVGTGEYFTMNEMGGEIWARLEAPMAYADLVRELQGTFDMPDDGEGQLEDFLARLVQFGVIDVKSGPSPA